MPATCKPVLVPATGTQALEFYNEFFRQLDAKTITIGLRFTHQPPPGLQAAFKVPAVLAAYSRGRVGQLMTIMGAPHNGLLWEENRSIVEQLFKRQELTSAGSA